MVAQDIKLSVSVAPAPHDPAVSGYRELWDILEDCEFAYRLGYKGVWTQEHHATSYYQVPGPLLFLSHVARTCPEFDLGTACLILPWHNPVRLAGELAMLAGLTKGDLQIGCGRGTSRHEFYAMSVDMSQSREHFDETLDILRLALTGKPFTFEGKFHSYPRTLTIHPGPEGKTINLYGAVGSVPSAQLMAQRAVAPLFVTGFPNPMLGDMVAGWKRQMQDAGHSIDVDYTIHGQLLMADTDEEAYELGRQYFPLFFKEMLGHYEVEKSAAVGVAGYEDFERVFESYRRWAFEPGAIDKYLARQFVGSPETVGRRIQELVDLGFNSFGLNAHVYGVPRSLRRDSLERFAQNVAPSFSPSFRPRQLA